MNDSILSNPDYKILKRVPNDIKPISNSDPKIFNATIVDLETMGLDPNLDEIIEIGLLTFSFTKSDGIIHIYDSYNELQQPTKPIPPEITKVTGITDDDVRGKSIDWNLVGVLWKN